MTAHVHKAHHRPRVRRLPKHAPFRWVAACDKCGFYRPKMLWRQAMTAANLHSEELT
jgi:hypothetical protein